MIEDIDFLKQHSDKDSVMIFIDSGDRDKKINPTPSEYSVSFSAPFKNVFSIDIVDASMPTTMYNIDIYNRELYITTVSKPAAATWDPYQYLKEISTSKDFARYFDDTEINYVLICSIAQLSSYDTNNPLINDKNTTYRIAVKYKTENINIVPYTNQNDNDYYIFEYQSKKYVIKNITANEPIINIIKEENYYLEERSDKNYNIIYYKFRYISQSIMNSIVLDNNYYVKINNYRMIMSIGNYNAEDFRFDLNTLMNDSLGIFIDPVGGLDTRQGKYRYYSSDLIVFNTRIRSLSWVMGFDLDPSLNDSNIYRTMTIGENYQLFIGNLNPVEKVYEIISPGMINLGGERFVILRCPEIESHMYGSYAYNSNTPGIGLFKIAAGQNETTHLRWDFTTLIRRPIHPVGKLSKMTFRFELPNGKLYDFKGINHQFLVSISFYIPSQHRNFDKYILNPNYNPNMIEYMTTAKNTQYKEENNYENSEDTDEDNEDKYKYYKKQLDKFNYEQESDQTDDSDD